MCDANRIVSNQSESKRIESKRIEANHSIWKRIEADQSGSKRIKADQSGSKRIKVDQIGSNQIIENRWKSLQINNMLYYNDRRSGPGKSSKMLSRKIQYAESVGFPENPWTWNPFPCRRHTCMSCRETDFMSMDFPENQPLPHIVFFGLTFLNFFLAPIYDHSNITCCWFVMVYSVDVLMFCFLDQWIQNHWKSMKINENEYKINENQ